MPLQHPLVSIICPTYNQEKFIARTLEGFVMQETTFPFEIIVHDDASTDRTTAIVREYEAKYPRLFANIYQTENQFSKAIDTITKLTFAAARGKYLALCEGDDYWTDPLKLQKQVDFLEANPDFSICFHRVKVIYEDGSKEAYISNQNQREVTTFEDLAGGNYIHTLSCLFRNNLFSEFPKWFADSSVLDYPIHLLNAQHGKIKFFNDVMGVYRVHREGIWETNSKIYRIEKMIFVVESCRKTFFPRGNQQFVINAHDMAEEVFSLIIDTCYKALEEADLNEFRKYYLKYLKYLRLSNTKQFIFLTQKYFSSFVKSSQNQTNF